MITNKAQLRVTDLWIRRFKESLDYLEREQPSATRKVLAAAMRSQIEEMEEEVARFTTPPPGDEPKKETP